MSTTMLEPQRESPTSEFIRRQVQKRTFIVLQGSEGWDAAEASGCEVKRKAERKYKGRSSKTRLDDVETEEDATEYLKRLKRDHEEGKTTRLP